MLRFKLAVALALTALGFSSVCLACGDRGTRSTGASGFPEAVSWAFSVEDAQKVAQQENKPFLIYFAPKEDAKIVGEDPALIREHMKANNNAVPSTVYDVPALVDTLKRLGVTQFVKVPRTKETAELYNHYNAGINNYALVAPSGEKIAMVDCPIKAANLFKPTVAQWNAKYGGEAVETRTSKTQDRTK